MSTGRSSYVEMHALERLTHHNIKARVRAIRSNPAAKDHGISEILSRIPAAVHGGYADVLTPNGVVRERELDGLLSIDSEIVTCLGVIESRVQSSTKNVDVGETLKVLMEERKRLVGSLRA